MFKMLNVLIFHSKKRANKKGLAPLYCRISINGLREEFSTGITVHPDEWDGANITTPTNEGAVNNAFLDSMKARIKTIYLDRTLKGEVTSPAMLRKIVTEKSFGPLFKDLMNDYFSDELPKLDFEESTVIKYGYLRSNILAFLHSKHIHSLAAVEFTIPLAEEMRKWMDETIGCKKGHVSRHLRLCRDVLRYGVKISKLENNPLQEIELQRDEDKEVIALSLEELAKISAHKFSNLIYYRAWDLFLFQAYTGLSYGDLDKFQIKHDNDGRDWIFSPRGRHKNEKQYMVPLFSDARAILEKYEYKLPRITNQTYNRILKEITAVAGVDKHLTTHVARKTFATLKDEEGWQLSTIARMMGNTERVLRRYYVTGSEKRIIKEMERLQIHG